MFWNFGGTRRITESLANQTIGAQSIIFRVFRELFDADPSSIRKLELTYFAAATVDYAFTAWGRSRKKDRVTRDFIEIVVSKSLPHAGESVSLSQALSEYALRRREYFRLIALIVGERSSSSGSPEVTLAMHVFETVTNSSAEGRMVRIAASGPAIAQLIVDNADFVKTQL